MAGYKNIMCWSDILFLSYSIIVSLFCSGTPKECSEGLLTNTSQLVKIGPPLGPINVMLLMSSGTGDTQPYPLVLVNPSDCT